MRLHVVLPNESVEVGPERILGLAQRAEELGLEGVWPPDHLLPPVDDGEIYGGVSEPLVTLAYIAAATTRIRLGTSVLLQTGVFAPPAAGCRSWWAASPTRRCGGRPAGRTCGRARR